MYNLQGTMYNFALIFGGDIFMQIGNPIPEFHKKIANFAQIPCKSGIQFPICINST